MVSLVTQQQATIIGKKHRGHSSGAFCMAGEKAAVMAETHKRLIMVQLT